MDIKATDNEVEQFVSRITEKDQSSQRQFKVLNNQIFCFSMLGWIMVAAGICIGLYGVSRFHLPTESEGYGLNELGDFLSGSVGTLWALAGLFFIYVAFLGQKQQLLQQQIEILYSQLEVKYTRLELHGQKKEMQEQNETLRLQKFENTFFQMLSLFNSIVNKIDIRAAEGGNVSAVGRDCFKTFYDGLFRQLRYLKVHPSSADISNTLIAYGKLYDVFKSDLSHYFRTLYHLIKFVDVSDIEDKKRYVSIARAQLSSYEQVMLFYNCLHSNGKEKFKPLVEKYHLFKNIDEGLILNGKHFDEYSKNAFSG